MNAKVTFLLLAVLGLAASPLRAELRLTVGSKQPARVWIGAQYIGETPARATLNGDQPQELVVEELATGRFRVYQLQGQEGTTSRQTWTVNFHGNCLVHEIVTRSSSLRPAPLREGLRGERLVAPQGPPPPPVVIRPAPVIIRTRPAVVIRRPVVTIGHKGKRRYRRW